MCCINLKLVFNPFTGEFQFVQTNVQTYGSAVIDFNNEQVDDLSIDGGDRSKPASLLDWGDRLIQIESV